MRRHTTAFALLVILLAVGSPTQLEAQELPDSIRSALVQRGAEVYSRQCQRCHVPRSPGERNDREWVIIMQHMQARANLTRDRARAALAFLLASNRSARTAASDETALAVTPDAVDGAMIDRGRAVYSGQGGCAACHGADLDGGPIAPSLVDDAWRNGDGSLASILRVVRTGVNGTAMAAFPGGIDEEQAAQVAAYIWAVAEGRTEP